MIFAGYLVTLIGLGLLHYGFQDALDKKMNAPEEGIGYVDFYDHRDDGIFHSRILKLGQGEITKLNTNNSTKQ